MISIARHKGSRGFINLLKKYVISGRNRANTVYIKRLPGRHNGSLANLSLAKCETENQSLARLARPENPLKTPLFDLRIRFLAPKNEQLDTKFVNIGPLCQKLHDIVGREGRCLFQKC